ncbi:hypothetical protein ACIBP6_14945 [Nonomuraea terrae]
MVGYCYTQLTRNVVYRFDRATRLDVERIRAVQSGRRVRTVTRGS